MSVSGHTQRYSAGKSVCPVVSIEKIDLLKGYFYIKNFQAIHVQIFLQQEELCKF